MYLGRPLLGIDVTLGSSARGSPQAVRFHLEPSCFMSDLCFLAFLITALLSFKRLTRSRCRHCPRRRWRVDVVIGVRSSSLTLSSLPPLSLAFVVVGVVRVVVVVGVLLVLALPSLLRAEVTAAARAKSNVISKEPSNAHVTTHLPIVN